MSDKFAARVNDPTEHVAKPLGPGPGSLNVRIGGMPAWRGMPAAGVAALKQAKEASDKLVDAAEKATLVAPTPESKATAKANEDMIKTTQGAAMAATIAAAAGGADLHACPMPMGIVPHGTGVAIEGARTVLINGLRACRRGDQIVEPLGPPHRIAMGLPTVIIGGRE